MSKVLFYYEFYCEFCKTFMNNVAFLVYKITANSSGFLVSLLNFIKLL